jgi:hypothetical protein
VKSGTESKLKFKQLQRRLNMPLYEARGLLDTLWNFTANNAPHGDVGKFTDEEIAIGLDWRREPSELIDTLTEIRWLDRVEGVLVIHDWPEHCEHTVHVALAKKIEVFACGTIPSLSRLPMSERPQIIEKYELKYGKDAVKEGKVSVSVLKRSETLSSVPSNAPALPLPSLTVPSLTVPEVGAASPPNDCDPESEISSPALPAVPAEEPPPPPAPAKKEIRPEDVPLPESLNVPEFIAARDAWFKQRRRKRLPMREEYLIGQYAALVPLGPVQAAACLAFTVKQDYSGVFPEKFANGKSPTSGHSSPRVGAGQRFRG